MFGAGVRNYRPPVDPIYTKEGGSGPVGQAQKEQIDRSTARNQVRIQREEKLLKEAQERRQLFADLQTKENALKNTLGALTDPNRTALSKSKTSLALGDSSNLSASAGPTASEGRYVVDIVSLASASQHVGKENTSQALSTDADLSGVTVALLPVGYTVHPLAGEEGSFFINGVNITFTGDDSVQSVLDQIQTGTANDPDADTVTATYDPATDKVTLSCDSEIRYVGNTSTNFMSALGLVFNKTNSVTSRSPIGAAQYSSTLENARLNTPITATGSFSINGVSFEYDTTSDSLETMRTKINSSEAGVRLVFDTTRDGFSLENIRKGALDIVSRDDPGSNFLEALGLNDPADVTRGDNTRFTINGGAQREATGVVLGQADHGVQGLCITAKGVGKDTLTVTKDREAAVQALNRVIETYNEVQEFLNEHSKKSSSLVSHKSTFYKFIRDDAEGLEGAAVSRFSQLGLRFAPGSTKKVDTLDASNKQLKEALDKHPAETYTFLETHLNKMKTWIESHSQPEGIFPASQKRTSNEIIRIKANLEKLQRENASARRAAHNDLISIENSSHAQTQGMQMIQSAFEKPDSKGKN